MLKCFAAPRLHLLKTQLWVPINTKLEEGAHSEIQYLIIIESLKVMDLDVKLEYGCADELVDNVNKVAF